MPLKWGILETSESRAQKAADAAGESRSLRKVVFATSLGTAFTVYDFILFGSLSPLIARHFFSGVNESAAFIFALLTFAVGFLVRPLGALVFSSMGDRSGRRKAFLCTITMMGFATFAIGLLPGYSTIGIASPVLLVVLRCMQGLAWGGEYGGAVIYAAEYAPQGRRGLFVGFVQAATGFGLFMSFLVIVITRSLVGESNFEAWGWRLTFLVSIFLLVLSVGLRRSLEESPLFRRMQAEGATSSQPLREAFATPHYRNHILLVLFGLMSLHGVQFYSAHFYSQFFLVQIFRVPAQTVYDIMLVVTGAGTLLYIFFCWLSDFVGRRNIILLGAMLSMASMWTLFHQLGEAANPALLRAHENSPVVVIADPADCSVQFDPAGVLEFTSSCDVARNTLADMGIGYSSEAGRPGVNAIVQIGTSTILSSINLRTVPADQRETELATFEQNIRTGLADAGYPESADAETMDVPMITGIIFLMIVFSTMVHAPMTIMALESFPTRIRCSALSLPYHIGCGWFGGFLPAISFAVIVATGDMFAGLWYPMGITALAILILTFGLDDTGNPRLDDPERLP